MLFLRTANPEQLPLLSVVQVPRGCSLNSHEHYEELCALATSGQASQPDLADLKAHLESCPSCRGLADDFTQLSAQSLSTLAAKRSQCQIPSGALALWIHCWRLATDPRIKTAQPRISRVLRDLPFAITQPASRCRRLTVMAPCRRQLALCRPDDDIVQVHVLAIGAPP